MRDPYSVLGVAKTAKPEEIKSAFRKLAKSTIRIRTRMIRRRRSALRKLIRPMKLSATRTNGPVRPREIDAKGKPLFQGFQGGQGFGGAHGDPFAGFVRAAATAISNSVPAPVAIRAQALAARKIF